MGSSLIEIYLIYLFSFDITLLAFDSFLKQSSFIDFIDSFDFKHIFSSLICFLNELIVSDFSLISSRCLISFFSSLLKNLCVGFLSLVKDLFIRLNLIALCPFIFSVS